MEVLLGWDRLGRLRLIKQADVVLLLALLGERYPRGPALPLTTSP
jgi:hypothetical protein